jgi:uncharacterized protein involved in exopolysaccharide biosynthesis
MTMKKILAALTVLVITSYVVVGYAQESAGSLSNNPHTTAAYEVLVLHKVSVKAELENLSTTFRSANPQLVKKRFELGLLQREMEKMAAIEKSRVPRLSSSYGTLILRKVALEVELDELLRVVKPRHPKALAKDAELVALKREVEKIMH